MGQNLLVIAGAGSGKTTFLVNEALKIESSKRVLITTYTRANENEVRNKINKSLNYIPENITIQTWFSFLIEHGVKPFQGCIYDKQIKGMILVNLQSALYIPEDNIELHYFSQDQRIYSDKISKFVLKCNTKTNGDVINRLSKIYDHILIDEVQDLACYDLDILKLLLESSSTILLVGDPRQGTYSTSNAKRNNKYKKSNIVNFFEDKTIKIKTDETSLTTNHRCVNAICELSDKLYPEYKKTTSANLKSSGHDGVFFIKPKDVSDYLKKYNPVQLRSDSRALINENYLFKNFGDSKGLEFERVLIYPTIPISNWLIDNKLALKPVSRSKFYVALTRAIYSVGIVCDYNSNMLIEGINKFIY